jgi:hypothetical protein
MYVRSKELGSLEEEKDISPQDISLVHKVQKNWKVERTSRNVSFTKH